MSATLVYRFAAIVFVLFAAGHTYGFLRMRPPSPEGRAVYEGMNSVRFELRGRSYSYGDFYRGFGLSCTVSLLFSAFVSWYLGGLARSAPGAIGALGWILFAAQVPGAVLSFLYFGVPPMVLSSLVASSTWVRCLAGLAVTIFSQLSRSIVYSSPCVPQVKYRASNFQERCDGIYGISRPEVPEPGNIQKERRRRKDSGVVCGGPE